MLDREQFLLDRKQGIGGSDVAAIIGLSSWKSPLGVYLDKVSDITDADKKNLKRGRKLEKYILDEYAEDKQVSIEIDLPQFKDSEYPFLVGHLDAKVKDKNIYIEAKSHGGNITDWQDKIPEYYLPQVAHYAYLTDADRVDVAVLANNWEYRCYTYQRDKVYENKIKQASIDFWQNHVLKRIPPELTCIADGNKLYPNSDDCIKYSDETIDSEISALVELQEYRKSIEKQEESLKAGIMDYMGTSSLLKSNTGYKISWKTQTQHRVNIELLKNQQPEIYNRFVCNINVRPFKLLKEKN